MQGKLIGADRNASQQALYFPYTQYKEEELLLPKIPDNPFDGTPSELKNRQSLSVYSQPVAVAARRPTTAKTQQELLMNIPGYKPPPVAGPDGAMLPAEAVPERPKTAREADPTGNDLMNDIDFADLDRVRQEEVDELYELKDRLVAERLASENPKNMKILMKAIL